MTCLLYVKDYKIILEKSKCLVSKGQCDDCARLSPTLSEMATDRQSLLQKAKYCKFK